MALWGLRGASIDRSPCHGPSDLDATWNNDHPTDFLRPPIPHTSIQAHSHRTAATMGGGDGGLIDRDKVRAVCRAGVKCSIERG